MPYISKFWFKYKHIYQSSWSQNAKLRFTLQRVICTTVSPNFGDDGGGGDDDAKGMNGYLK